jgi:multicomponent Na+:H+ antiporter subunit D
VLSHLPILQVILPFLAAPSCLLLRRARLAWAFALAVSGLALVVSALLLQQVIATGTISYALGGWAPPWGIEYRIDLLNAYVLLIVSAIATLVLLGAYASVQREVDAQKQSWFYALYLLCFAGLLGIVATGDAFNVFVFLEISSLSTYALIALGRDRRALWAAYQYLIMGTIGATFLLIGIGFLYMMTGTLNMQDLAARLPAVESTSTVLAAFAFIVVGTCLKLALFPLHLWLPNAYTYAPSIVTAFIAATATKVAVYVLIRFLFTIFGEAFSFGRHPLAEILLPLAIIGLLSASTVSIAQPKIKRMLAYSSVAQIAYIVLGIAMGTALGLTAALLHVFNHALMKGALFMALAGVTYRLGGSELQHMRGLARTMPLTFWGFVLGGLSLIGVPLTVGFVSKWYLILAAVELGWWPVVIVILLGSLLAVIYIGRVVEAGWFGEAENPGRNEAPLSLLIPLWLLIAANIYFGLDTRLTVGVAESAAAYLMDSEVIDSRVDGSLMEHHSIEISPGERHSASGYSIDNHSIDGPSADGLSEDGPSVEGPSEEGPSVEEFSEDGPSVEEFSVKGASEGGASVEGSSEGGPSEGGPSVNGPSEGGLPVEGASEGKSSVEGPSADGGRQQ